MRPLVFAVINVTPDSFSDGGHFLAPEAAVQQAREAMADGADVLDIGGESTRPSGGLYGQGPREISVEEELDRVMPVVERLRRSIDAPISIDTRKSKVAAAALAAGARYVNDVSAGTFDPELPRVVGDFGAELILMHARGTPETMASRAKYANLVSEVSSELLERVDAAVAAGVKRERIWLDPGFGFAKTPGQSRTLLRELPTIVSLGFRVLAGPSRKSMLGSERPPADRVPESIAASLLAVQGGVTAVRVHDVGPIVRALKFLSLAGVG